MTNINFQRLEVFTDIAKTQCTVVDVRNQIADAIYQNGRGIASHAVALKIYNSQGDTEYTDEEYALIKDFVAQFGSPALIDAVNKTTTNSNDEDSQR